MQDEQEQQQPDSDQVENDPRGDAIEGGSAPAAAGDAPVAPEDQAANPQAPGEGQGPGQGEGSRPGKSSQ